MDAAPITDPVVIEDINAHLAQRVHEAVLEAELQRAGLLPRLRRFAPSESCCGERY